MMWKQGTVGDILSMIQNGVNCKQNKNFEGNKITRIETISDAKVNYSKTGFAFLNDQQKVKSELKKGDILFSHINSPSHVGKTAIYTGEEKLYHGINLLRLKTTKEVDSIYFNYFLCYLFWNGYWNKNSKQSINQASVNQADIKAIPFSYPEISDQKRIVAKLEAIFSEIDKLITHQKERQNHYEIVISKMQNNLFEDSNSIPKDIPLGEIAIFENGDRGKNYPSKKYQIDKGIPFVNAGDFSSNGDITKDRMSFISEERFNLLSSGKFKLNDILFCLRGSLGKSAFNKNIEIGAIASSLVIIRAKKDIVLPDYIFAYVRSNIVMNYIKETASGTAQPNLPASVVMNYKIPLFDFDRQNQIASKFWQLRKEGIYLHKLFEQKIQLLNSLKKAILKQELRSELV